MSKIAKHTDRKETCESVGGFLAEIHTIDDAQTLQYLMYHLDKTGKKSANIFALGARSHNGRWIWDHSGYVADVGVGKLLKPSSEDVDVSPINGRYIYLSMFNPYSASLTTYQSALPYFDLFAISGSDTEEEYLCMKKGLEFS